jgi:anti-anti-sigma factor
MKRHQAMAAKIRPRSQGNPPENLATQIAARNPDPAVPHLELTAGALSVRPELRRRRRPRPPRAVHTLLLSGRLDRSSTHMLEAEIERLCEWGVGTIALDLAQLSGIDFSGLAVIAFRRQWCRRHGCELLLVRGSPEIRLAFDAAGAGDLICEERPNSPTDLTGSPAAVAAGEEIDEAGAPIDPPGTAIVAADAPPSDEVVQIVAGRIEDDPRAAPLASDGATAPIEEAGAATA